MRKIICLLAIAFTLHTSSFAQTVTVTKEAAANEEIKTSLVSKLQFSNDAADKIVAIEEEFHASLDAIKALGDIPNKEREEKLNKAHVTRRAKLMDVPMKPRQMEDVVDLVESIRRKHKL